MGRVIVILLLLALAIGGYLFWEAGRSSLLDARSTTLEDVIREARARGYDVDADGRTRTEVRDCVWTPCGGCVDTLAFDGRTVSGVTYYDKGLTRFESPDKAACNAGNLLFSAGMRCEARGYFTLCVTRRLQGHADDDPFYRIFMAL